MRRGGFTMIELIFVIVILGILAAVALPKFIGVSEQAREGKLKAFVGTLNRSVGPTLWSRNMATNGGSVTSETNLSKYTDIPKEIETNPVSLAQCGDDTQDQFKVVAEVNSSMVPGNYAIACRDGNATTAPAFVLAKGVTGVGTAVSSDKFVE